MNIKVVCAIIKFGQKTLVVQRSKHMKLPLKWEFPGGKIEPNESEINCIKREIREELNIEIEVGDRLRPSLFRYPNVFVELIPYTAKYSSGKLILREHNRFLLLETNELSELDWAEADIPIVEEYKKI